MPQRLHIHIGHILYHTYTYYVHLLYVIRVRWIKYMYAHIFSSFFFSSWQFIRFFSCVLFNSVVLSTSTLYISIYRKFFLFHFAYYPCHRLLIRYYYYYYYHYCIWWFFSLSLSLIYFPFRSTVGSVPLVCVCVLFLCAMWLAFSHPVWTDCPSRWRCYLLCNICSYGLCI